MADAVPPARAIALVGNAVALALIGLLLLAEPLLFGAAGARPAAERGAIEPGPPALLLVVIDALRDDTARDPERMPALAALAARGTRATWWVDLLLPSTIGSLERLVEGRAPPPVAALRDFGARAAPDGGWLQDVVERGGTVFVAGPDLWTERYGRWIDAWHVEDGLPSAASDRRVAAAARGALGDGAARVVVVHLAELDATAHRHGAAGPEWDATARRVDARLAEVLDAVTDERAVVVLADHGVTRQGGHAGGEAVVRRAPLVAVATAPLAAPCDEWLDPTAVVRALLADGTPCAARATAADVPEPVGGARAAVLGAALVVGGLGALVGARALAAGGVPGFALSASLWLAIALAASGRVGAGALLAVFALASGATLALASARRPGVRPGLRPGLRPWATASLAALAGAALAATLVLVASRTADAPPFGAIAPPALAALVGIAAGAAVARLRSARAAGVALAAAIAVAVLAGGETASLSSVDVRIAHHAAALAPGPWGIVLATPIALARLALPIAAVLVGFLLARGRGGDPDGDALALASGFGAVQIGAGAVYAWCLWRPTDAPSSVGLPLAAAGFGGLLRECVTCALVFGTLAVRAASRAPVRGQVRAGAA